MEKAGGDGIAVSSTGSLIVLHPCNENARLAFMNSPHLIQFNIFSQKKILQNIFQEFSTHQKTSSTKLIFC